MTVSIELVSFWVVSTIADILVGDIRAGVRVLNGRLLIAMLVHTCVGAWTFQIGLGLALI